MTDDRRAVLEGIAFGNDPKVSPADRLRALELLGPKADGAALFDFTGLSDEQLDRELAGFFDPGAPPPSHDGEPLPARWERRVQRRVRREVKRLAKQFDQRVETAARRIAGQDAQRSETRTAGDDEKVVPLRERRLSQAEQTREQVRREAADARRAGLPPSQRQHVPPGLDPATLGRAWPSGRP